MHIYFKISNLKKATRESGLCFNKYIRGCLSSRVCRRLNGLVLVGFAV